MHFSDPLNRLLVHNALKKYSQKIPFYFSSPNLEWVHVSCCEFQDFKKQYLVCSEPERY